MVLPRHEGAMLPHALHRLWPCENRRRHGREATAQFGGTPKGSYDNTRFQEGFSEKVLGLRSCLPGTDPISGRRPEMEKK